MSDRTIRYALVSAFAVIAIAAAAPPVHGAERLCDPSFQNCRDGAGNLLDLINSETQGIDVAFWFMEDQRYATALINRWKYDHLPVRLIVDPRANSTYPLNVQRLGELQSAGIPMIKKTGGGIMHWKTMIFAGQGMVEFGSANYSPNAFVPDWLVLGQPPYTNYVTETIIYSDDPAVVNSFMIKFDDLWTDTTNYTVYANVSSRTRVHPGTDLDIIDDLNFPPGKSYANKLIALEKAETKQIDVQMYRITEQAHSDAMIAARQRGVPIRYIGETKEYRELDPHTGLPTRIWVSWNMDRMYAASIPMQVRKQAGEYHSKVVLLHGQETSVFGSSNWTSPSDNSQQEHNYFTKKTAIFQWFDNQFNRMWNNTTGVTETVPFVPLPPQTPSNRSIANGATAVPTTGQKLVWYGGFWAHYYDVYFGTTPPTGSSIPFAANLLLGPSQTTSQTQSFTLPTLQPGTTYYWQIVSKTAAYPRAGSAVSKAGPVWSFTTAGSGGGGGGGGSLPAPWLDKDIGSVGIAGSAQYSNGTFTISASGADIWGTADAFHFVYQPWSGDGSIVARVGSIANSNSNTNAWAKAGVMFRTSLDAGSAQAMMIVSAANGVSFQWRTTAGGTSVSTNVSGMLPPQWVRLDRSGNTLYAYQSHDGVTWGAAVGTATIAFPTSLYVGIAVTSHNNSALTTASVGTVVVSSGGGGGGGGGGSLPAPWLQSDIGAVGVAGTGQDTNGTMTVQASGADIWGSADAFHYVYQPWTGDGTFVAHVASLINTNSWAKAGVMIRETLDPGSVHASVFVTPGNGLSFIRRTTTNGTSVSTTTSGITAPRWIRLVRSGSTLTVSYSNDGTVWTQAGTAMVTLPQSLFVGLAVTSHDNTKLTTAQFDMGSSACPGCWDY